MNALIARYSLLATACSVIFTASSQAHKFIIKPTQDRVELGAKVPFSILATHVFMVSEEAYATESLDDGIAYVKVTSPGVWVVRVEKRIETNARDFDLLSLKATLVFSVQ